MPLQRPEDITCLPLSFSTLVDTGSLSGYEAPCFRYSVSQCARCSAYVTEEPQVRARKGD